MPNNISDFIKTLLERGRKVGCFSIPDKESESLTLQEQKKITGYLLEESSHREASIAMNHLDMSGNLSNYLITNEEKDKEEFIEELSKNVISYYYIKVEDLLKTTC